MNNNEPIILQPAPLNCGYYKFGQHYSLSDKAYMVFGSNLKGVHGAGAAKTAARYFGAQFGVGEGFTGRSYALPTKDMHIRTRCIDDVIVSIRKFVAATQMSGLEQEPEEKNWFYVTPVVTGLAGFPHELIAPHFRGACNCWFPDIWRPYLGNIPGYYENKDCETETDTAIYAYQPGVKDTSDAFYKGTMFKLLLQYDHFDFVKDICDIDRPYFSKVGLSEEDIKKIYAGINAPELCAPLLQTSRNSTFLTVVDGMRGLAEFVFRNALHRSSSQQLV